MNDKNCIFTAAANKTTQNKRGARGSRQWEGVQFLTVELGTKLQCPLCVTTKKEPGAYTTAKYLRHHTVVKHKLGIQPGAGFVMH